MTRRMLDSGIWANEHFASLPAMARLLQIGIINLADDQGRMKAHPLYVRSQVFPYDDVTTAQVAEWLHLIAGNGTIQLYTVEGKEYLQLLNWWAYQPLDWARPSEYPPPPGWQDRIRYNAKGNIHLSYNWTTKTGAPMPDTCDCRGNPRGAAGVPRTPPSTPPPAPPPAPPDDKVPTEAPTEVPTPPKYADKLDIDIDQNKQEAAATCARACEVEADPEPSAATAAVWQCWNDNMPGAVTQVISDGVNQAIDDYGPNDVIRAIAIAVRRNHRTLGYVEGILQKGVDSQPPPKPTNGSGPPTGSIDKEAIKASGKRLDAEAQRTAAYLAGTNHRTTPARQ